MKAILVGFGEIGKSVYEVFSKYHQIETFDVKNGERPAGQFEILLVAIPFIDDFKEVIRGYQKEFETKSTIVFSTTAVGTCAEIGAVHCPVEGRHPDLAESIRVSDKWLGGRDELAEKFLKEAEFNVMVLGKPEYTEFLKLRSTTIYGVNVEFARYTKNVCEKIGLDFEETKKWDSWYNDIYKHLGMDWAHRYILDPPEGKKGGHCVTPNAKILYKQFPDELVRIVAEEDLKDEDF